MGIELAQAFVNVRAQSNQIRPDLQNVRGVVVNELQNIGGLINGMMSAFASAWVTQKMISVLIPAGQFEQTQIAFETMLGSAQLTQRTLEDLTEFAAKTPFEMPEILQAARGLIQFGERGEELMNTLKMLGNAASGSSTPFGFLALVFNQVRGVGKLLTQDFRQLSTRGILSLQDIAKFYKVSTEEAQKMLSSGKITFIEFKKIMESLSMEGGRFANMMEKQSQSLLGLWSTFKDAIGIIKRSLGETLMPMAKKFINLFIAVGEQIRAIVQQSPTLVRWIMEFAIVLGLAVTALIAYGLACKLAASSQILMMALQGPGGWARIALGIGVAVGAIELMGKVLNDSAENSKKLTEELKKTAAAGAGIKPPFTSAQQEYNAAVKKKRELEKQLKEAESSGGEYISSRGARGQSIQVINAKKALETVNAWFDDVSERFRKEKASPKKEEEKTGAVDKEKFDTGRVKFEDYGQKIQDLVLKRGVEQKLDVLHGDLEAVNGSIQSLVMKPQVEVGFPRTEG